MSIKLAHLSTGEDVIADVTGTIPEYKFKKPVRIIMTEQGLGMMPFAPLVKGTEVYISAQHVVFIAEVEPELANEYNAKFGNGIVTAAPSLKLTT